MKKASLKETASKHLEEREKFIHDGEAKASTGIIKKTSNNIPQDVWIKFMEWKLSQAKQGKEVTFNGLVVDLLSKFLDSQDRG